jgi:hypothetical protein
VPALPAVATPAAAKRKGVFRSSMERHGFWKTFADSSIRFANRYVYFQILKGVTIERADPKFLKCDEKYRGEFIPNDLLRDLVANPENELDDPFLDRVLPQGDECYGFFQGAELAGYGWYSNKPSRVDVRGLLLHFDPQYMYMYKGHTHRKHRGQRLHAVGMTRALDAYVKRGYKGLVSYVAWENTDSLKSCYRMGYKDFGNVYIVRIFGRYFFYNGAGCEKYGFCLKREI